MPASRTTKHFGGFGVEQRDALPLITGRASFRTTQSGVSGLLCPEIPISNRWVVDVIESLDPDFQHSVVFLSCVHEFAKLKFLVFDFRGVIFVSV